MDEAYWQDGIFFVHVPGGLYTFPAQNIIGIFTETGGD